MSLYTQLKAAKSEEDVKDAYIKALGLKSYTKGLIDIQTQEIWFEAKDTGRNSSYAMFTQLLHYVQVALNAGEALPPFLAVIDTPESVTIPPAPSTAPINIPRCLPTAPPIDANDAQSQ